MRLLHTSDWHLGRLLYGQKRFDEFERFLLWLSDFISAQKIETLLIAGDVFDTTTPSNRATELYYQFLSRVSCGGCRHVVVIGGNHDSPTFLNAPKTVLKALNIHVVGEMCQPVEEEVIVLSDEKGCAELIVCAVPFLRDRDVRSVDVGESIDDKSKKLIDGIVMHYQQVGEAAEGLRQQVGNVPIVGMGHLFAAGGRIDEGDGVRDLYVGTLAYVNGQKFPSCFDYLALGHLHIAQKVGDEEHKRYSGSPLAMGFNEANQQKKLIVVDFENGNRFIEEHDIPCFQKLIRIVGDALAIQRQIEQLKSENSNAWLEIECTKITLDLDLNELVNDAVKDSLMIVIRVKNRQIEKQVLNRSYEAETLEDLDHQDVFVRCLDSFHVDADKRDELMLCYQEIVAEMAEKDVNAN